jgi:uncharacterized tellurite resistance protein B-like protein
MSILEALGFRRGGPRTESGDTDTVRKIVRELESLAPERARYLAAFAFVLARVAHADLEVSEEETHRMEQILQALGHLPAEQARLAVSLAKAQYHVAGGTEGFLVTREFREIATREQCRELLDCLFAVSAADDSISGGRRGADPPDRERAGVQPERAFRDPRRLGRQARDPPRVPGSPIKVQRTDPGARRSPGYHCARRESAGVSR